MDPDQDPNASGDSSQEPSGYDNSSNDQSSQSQPDNSASDAQGSPGQTDDTSTPSSTSDNSADASAYTADTGGVQMGTLNPLDPNVMQQAARHVLEQEETAIRNWIETNTKPLSERMLTGMPGLVSYVKTNAPDASSQADEQIQIWLNEWAQNHNLVIPPFDITRPIPPRTIAAPDRQRRTDDDAVRLGVDLAGDTHTYQVSLVLRNANAISGGDCGPALDVLHEPQAGIQIQPPPDNQYVVQAAINILDLHLRNHCRELVEATLAAQGGVNLASGTPSGGGQVQIEIHITSTLSITAASTVSATPHGSGGSDPGSVPVGTAGGADFTFAPFAVAALVHF